MTYLTKIGFTLLFCSFFIGTHAQEVPVPANDSLPSLEDILNVKVDQEEELMNAPVSVAGQKDQIIQEAPSIISVITKEDIANYGARDISDVLNMVPGFEYGWDIQGLTGLSFRGIWVHEGKALIMVNGVMINDLAYGNANLIGTIPTAMIERVEIIRGPGSVIYGGFAEAMVINVITHTGTKLDGGQISGSGGLMGTNGTSYGGAINYGMSNKNSEFSVNLGYTDQPLTTRPYNDFYGNTLQTGNANTYRQYMYAIAKGRYKGFSFNYHRSTQYFAGQDGYNSIDPMYNNKLTEAYTNFTEALTLKQDIKISRLVNLVPTFQVNRGDNITSALLPLSVGNSPYGLEGGTKMYHFNGNILSNWDLRRGGQIVFGGSLIRDQMNMTSSAGNPGLQTGPNPGDTAYDAHTDMKSIMLEYTNKFDAFGVTVGGRYENTKFGDAFAPRVGLTYVFKRFNAKLLYGNAYRVPLLFEAYSRTSAYAGNLHPETSNSVELECGYKFTSSVSARVNFFRIDIESPIKYDGLNNIYTNTGSINSYGTEGEVAFRFKHWGGFVNGSLALPGASSSKDLLTADKKNFLGVSSYKFVAGLYYNVKKLQISPSLIYTANKTGQAFDTLNTYANTSYPAVLLLNLSVTYNNLIKNLDLRLTGTNLLDEKYEVVQTYYGYHAPMTAFDRHLTLTAILRLPN